MKRIVHWFIIIVCIVLAVQLVRSIVDLVHRGSIVQQARERLENKQREHDELAQKLSQVQSDAFVEGQARDKLNMARKGEVVAIVEQPSPTPTPTPTPLPDPNWRQWMKVFRF